MTSSENHFIHETIVGKSWSVHIVNKYWILRQEVYLMSSTSFLYRKLRCDGRTCNEVPDAVCWLHYTEIFLEAMLFSSSCIASEGLTKSAQLEKSKSGKLRTLTFASKLTFPVECEKLYIVRFSCPLQIRPFPLFSVSGKSYRSPTNMFRRLSGYNYISNQEALLLSVNALLFILLQLLLTFKSHNPSHLPHLQIHAVL